MNDQKVGRCRVALAFEIWSSLDGVFDLGEDIVDATDAFDSHEGTLASVVVDEGHGVLAVHLEPVLDGFLPVVVPLVERSPALVADAILLGGIVDQVVNRVALGAGASFGQPVDELVIIHVQVQGEIYVQLLGESVGLLHGPGEPVEDNPSLGLDDLLLHEPDNEVVGHEGPRVHIFLGFLAQLGVVSHGLAEYVACGEPGVAKLLAEFFALCTLPGARGSEKNDSGFHDTRIVCSYKK